MKFKKFMKVWAKGLIPNTWGKAFTLVIPVGFTIIGIKLNFSLIIMVVWISFIIAYTFAIDDDEKMEVIQDGKIET
jgi:hypothetical protein